VNINLKLYFALPFLQAARFLQASEMMKSLTSFDFHLSLEKNVSAAFSRSAGKHNFKLIFTIHFVEKVLKLN